MRQLLFRAWDERKQIMHNNFKFITSGSDGNDWIVFVSDKQPLTSQPHPFENPHFSQQLKIMQFTGLKDKNGIDIYEKDFDADGNMIDYCERCCGYQFFQIDVPTKDIIFCHNCEGNFMVQDHIPDFVIASNLHEHSHLLVK